MIEPQNIKLEWLYYFVVLAETRHFSEAARKLCMTQQALSKVVLQLENELKVNLIHRRPWELTEYGQLFLEKVKGLLIQLNLIEHFWLDRYREIQHRPLQIAVEPGLESLIADICLNLQASYPEFQFHLQTQHVNPEAALLHNEMDLFIQISSHIQNHSLSYETCVTSEMVLVASPDFELAEDLNPLIEYQGSLIGLPLVPNMISLQPSIQAPLTVAIELAKASMGILWIPACLIQTELLRRELKRIDVPTTPLAYVEFQCVYHPRHSCDRPPLRALLTALKRIESLESYQNGNVQGADVPKAEYVSL